MNPICRADGVQPFNQYLWPTESWRLNQADRNFNSRWRIAIVALMDGRFAIDGCVSNIEKNDIYDTGRKCCYPIRASAAELIRTMRVARTWPCGYGGMVGAELATAINWALAVVARETHAAPPRQVCIPEPPPEIRPEIKPALYQGSLL